MLPIGHRSHENRSILHWASAEDSGFWTHSHSVLEADYRPVVREQKPSIAKRNRQRICSLCEQFERQITSCESSEDVKSCVSQYKDFGELNELARAGCETCRIIRATILYHHPEKNAYDLLLRDDEYLTVRVKEEGAAIVGLNVSYPYKADMREFDYDPQWPPPMGKPSAKEEHFMRMVGLWDPHRPRYRAMRTANVDVPLLPKGDCMVLQAIDDREMADMRSNEHGEVADLSDMPHIPACGEQDPELHCSRFLNPDFYSRYISFIDAGDAPDLREVREQNSVTLVQARASMKAVAMERC